MRYVVMGTRNALSTMAYLVILCILLPLGMGSKLGQSGAGKFQEEIVSPNQELNVLQHLK